LSSDAIHEMEAAILSVLSCGTLEWLLEPLRQP
jgi:hypothetical protein